MTPILSLQHVSLYYGTEVAVHNLSFDVAPGEIFGLLGPNGSGKSTTLTAIAGDHPPTHGTIHLAGRAPTDDPLAYRRQLGLVPQEIALFEDLTAAQNLTFFARLYNLRGPHLQRRLAEVLAFVRLEDHAHRRVRTYSGGMQRRLNLACALLHSPRLLLLDEPTVGLDVQSREAIFACLRQLRDTGSAMIFTTHHLEEAEQLCDRIGIIDHGRLVISGSLPDLHTRWRLDPPHTSSSCSPFREFHPQESLERLFLHYTGRSPRDP